MKLLAALRLLLEVYGALFILLIVVPPAVYGVLPYEGLLRLGPLLFYALCGIALALWLWLAGRVLAGRGAQRDPSQP